MIRHLLLDADGLVQDLPGGWRSALRPFLGDRVEEFVAEMATNQSPERAAYMRRELGYDARFDTQFYSCELGVARPERGYFERILVHDVG